MSTPSRLIAVVSLAEGLEATNLKSTGKLQLHRKVEVFQGLVCAGDGWDLQI